MRRLQIVVALTAALSLWPSAVFAYTGTSAPALVTDTFYSSFGNGTYPKAATPFTTIAAGTMYSVDVRIWKQTGNDNIDIQLRPDNGSGAPSNTVLETYTVLKTDLTQDACTNRTTTFTYAVSASTTYWIVYRTPTTSNSYYYCGRGNTGYETLQGNDGSWSGANNGLAYIAWNITASTEATSTSSSSTYSILSVASTTAIVNQLLTTTVANFYSSYLLAYMLPVMGLIFAFFIWFIAKYRQSIDDNNAWHEYTETRHRQNW